MKKVILSLAIVLGILSCNTNQSPQKEEGKILIVATTSIIKDALENILTDDFQVVSLMGIGVDPHVYKPSGKDVKLLKNADLVVYNGLALEGKMEDVLEKLAQEKTVINLSSAIPQDRLIFASDMVEVYDPHFWFDLEIWATCVEYLSIKISDQFAQHKEAIEKNALIYSNKLLVKDKEIEELVNNWQSEHRYVVTAHDALSYYAKRYGIKMMSLQGSSTVSEFGIKDLNEMIAFLIENNIGIVYPENITNDQSLKALINGCKARGHDVKMGSGFFSDAVGPQGSGGTNLLEMIDFNTKAIISH